MRAKSLIVPSLALLAAPAIVHSAAYANTLTGLIPSLYAGVDVVSRELVGFIPSVFRNTEAERAAVGQSVVYPITPAQSSFSLAPAMVIPEPSDETVGTGTITISKAKGVAFGWVGEEQRGLNTGPGYQNIARDNFAQAIRTLCNEIEADLAATAAAGASRAWGTSGTTPFASDLSDPANIRKILDDNGAPPGGRSLIINTTAGAKLRTLAQLTKANESGTLMTLRDGTLLDIHGMMIKESAAVVSFTKGTNNGSASTDNAGYAVGATTFTLASAGTGTLKAGDVITFAGDTNQYVVTSGDTDVSNGGTFKIAAPGLRVAIAASNTVITTTNSYAANVAFSQNAVHLVARLPALPQEGDAAIDSMLITDPRSGLTFEIRVYAGYRKIRAEVGLAWGFAATKAEHIALLKG